MCCPTLGAADELDLDDRRWQPCVPVAVHRLVLHGSSPQAVGIVVVDDVELWTGLSSQTSSTPKRRSGSGSNGTTRFAVYRLVGDKREALERSWVDQPHVFKNSDLAMTGHVRPSLSARVAGQPVTVRLRRMARRTWWKVRN